MEYGHFLKKGSLLHEPFYLGIGIRNYASFWARQKDNLAHVQRLGLLRKLSVHDGCVNSIVWNDVGTRILSGSDDHRLAITDPFTGEILSSISSGHRANIFAATFFPSSDDNHIVSCCGAGEIRYTVADRPETYGQCLFDCHQGTTYDVVTIPSEPHIFLSCGEDCTIRMFDLRMKTSCTKAYCQDDVLIRLRKGVTTLSVNPRQSYYLATGSSDSIVRIFDRRMLSAPRSPNDFSSLGVTCQFRPPSMISPPANSGPDQPTSVSSCPITCVRFAPDGEECLVSYSGDYLYLFDSKATLTLDEMLKEMSQGARDGPASTSSSHQSVKRLRLRGDWSDTGPNARPERERQNRVPANEGEEREQRFYATMQRVSDMLTNWLVSYMNRQPSPGSGASNNEEEGSQNESAANSASSQPIQSDLPAIPPSLLPVASLLGVRLPPTSQRPVQATEETAEARPSQDTAGDDDEEADTDSPMLSSRSGTRRTSRTSTTSSTLTDEDENQQRNEAAVRVQRFFRRRAKEKKRQLREWNEVPHCRQTGRFTGHRSVRTMIKEANFWGDRYVISGSDCGNVFMWDRKSAQIVNVLEADRHVVNCVQPHPTLPLLASSGIDYDVKLFAPVLGEPDADGITERAVEFSRRNAVMLEESRDTLTVPASFMLRVLAAFNHLTNSSGSS